MAVVAKGLGDGFGGAKERHSKIVADNRDVFAKAIVEELAILELQVEDVLEVIASRNDSVRLVNLLTDRDSGIADSDRGDAFDVFDLLDGFDIFEGEVGLGILASMSQLVDDAVRNFFAVTWADQDEVGVVFVAAGADEAINAAGQRHDEDDAGDANCNAERGQESATAVLAEAIHGEVEVGV